MKICVLLLIFINTGPWWVLGHGPQGHGRGPPGLRPPNEKDLPPGIIKKIMEMWVQLQKPSGCKSPATDSLPTMTNEQTTTTAVTTALDGSTGAANTASSGEPTAEPTLNESTSEVDSGSNTTDPMPAVTAEPDGTAETTAESTQSTSGDLGSNGGSESSTDSMASTSGTTAVV
ncbi:uncharacterized protein LOC144145654 [Haemaphysalis longicornis]